MNPVALTIAGSDCSAGAGLQADLKAMQHFGVHGLCAVTCVVSETPLTVRRIDPVSTIMVQDQVNLLLDSYPVAAIKTGMLYSKAHILAINEIVRERNIPLVVDPVMIASSGAQLLEDDAIKAMKRDLLHHATLITPNMPEAAALADMQVDTVEQMQAAATAISEKFNTACLIKAGHLSDCNLRTDYLKPAPPETQIMPFSMPNIDLETDGIHGTGCTLSAAITANLALGKSLPDAIAAAKQYIHEAISKAHHWTHQNQKITSLNFQ